MSVEKSEAMGKEKQNWLHLADKFALEGDFRALRACGREILELDDGDADGLAVLAEVSLYLGEIEEAERLVGEALRRDAGNLRGRFVQGGICAARFQLDKAIPMLCAVLDAVEGMPADAQASVRNMRLRAHGWLADAYYLFARPETAAQHLFSLSRLAVHWEDRASFYSKGLFMTNYFRQPVMKSRGRHEQYSRFFHDVLPYYPPLAEVGSIEVKHHLRVGYISPDFRLHAAAYFFAPLFLHCDRLHFDVFCYSAGGTDRVTERFKRSVMGWRGISGLSPRKAAELIYADKLDILVDLAGHTQNNCLPVLAYRPAPVQVSGIGYMNTTGLSAVDYFLSDCCCMPPGEEAKGFVERILRLPRTHLCYAPDILREMPETSMDAPFMRKGYVTFGCFNNFAKVSEETLHLWRGILERKPKARLIIKAKICSIPSGRREVKARMKALGFNWRQVELRPYSPDYLEQYRDIDIALDTMPYTGGLTTCEALYMGVPVITLRGRTHGERFGASILTNAGLAQLVAESEMDYVSKAVQLASEPQLLRGLHRDLRQNMKNSPIMDAQGYMRDLEEGYWRMARGEA